MTMKDQLAKVREALGMAIDLIERVGDHRKDREIIDYGNEALTILDTIAQNCACPSDMHKETAFPVHDTIAQAGDEKPVDDAEVRMAIDVLEDMMVGGGIHVVECDAIRTLIKAATAKTGGKGE